jgi:AcrR family transcriptional regulator
MTDQVSALDPRVERSQAAVLEAAKAILLEGGVAALTVEAVVERSGVARSTIYRHWDSRRELLVAALEVMLPNPRDPEIEGPLRDRLIALGEMHIERLRNAPWAAAMPTFLEATSRDPELAGVRERIVEANSGPTRRTLELAIERGELPADTEISEAIAQIAGPVLFRHLIVCDPLDKEFVRRNVDRFLAGFGATT